MCAFTKTFGNLRGRTCEKNPEATEPNIAANVVMGWTTVRARVVVQNLGFLHQLVSAGLLPGVWLLLHKLNQDLTFTQDWYYKP